MRGDTLQKIEKWFSFCLGCLVLNGFTQTLWDAQGEIIVYELHERGENMSLTAVPCLVFSTAITGDTKLLVFLVCQLALFFLKS